MRGFSVVSMVFAALLSFSLAACVTAPPVKEAIATQDVSDEGVRLVNAFRAQHGLKPVVIDSNLVSAARRQVIAMASRNLLSHEADGDFTTRINAAGFSNAAAAENVGTGHPNVASAINAWIASPHHRDNMLMPEATRIGLVWAPTPDRRASSYWALEIASAPAQTKTAALFGLTSLFGQ